ncbi:MAG: hypothetical protein SangKO_057020 [Sandaracinaceae bacterium]
MRHRDLGVTVGEVGVVPLRFGAVRLLLREREQPLCLEQLVRLEARGQAPLGVAQRASRLDELR